MTKKRIPDYMNQCLEQWRAEFIRYKFSNALWETLQQWVLYGNGGQGDFMLALLCNDLAGAVAHADDDNRTRLHEWVMFLFNSIPAAAWGSREKCNAWRSSGGWMGIWDEADTDLIVVK